MQAGYWPRTKGCLAPENCSRAGSGPATSDNKKLSAETSEPSTQEPPEGAPPQAENGTTHYDTLLATATLYETLLATATRFWHTARYCYMLRHTGAYGYTLRHNASFG